MSDTYSPCPSCHSVNRVPTGPLLAGGTPACSRCKTALRLHAAVSEVDDNGLRALVEKSPLPVLVDFWAPWCAPCRAFAPIFEKASGELAGEVVLAKLDTEASPSTGNRLGIQAIPTLVLFRGGHEVARQPGAMQLSQLLLWARGAAAA